MISGTDIIIPTLASTAAIDFAIRAARKLWRGAIIEDAETGKQLNSIRAMVGFLPREVLIYKDSNSARQWEEMGADDSLRGSMIHLVISPGALTLVVDAEPTPPILEFVAAVQKGLWQDIFRIRVQAAA